MATPTAIPNTLQEAIEYFAVPDRCHEFAVQMRWPGGVSCPTCGASNPRYLASRRVFECRAKHAQKQFSVKVGTIFEDSPVALKSWLLAMWMVANCKNGVSSYEVARAIGVTQKTAWFMLHRIRLAMQEGQSGPFSGHVEADETFIGGAARFMHKSAKERKLQGRTGHSGKAAVFGLLERGKDGKASRVRTKVIKDVRRNTLQQEIREQVELDGNTTIYTDALRSYETTTRKWTRKDREQPIVNDYIHKVIDHAEAYVDGVVHTNGMENFWSLLKRSIKGTYVSVEPFHLFRYLDEQAFRFNERETNDGQRFAHVLRAVIGRRLTFKSLTGQQEATA